MTYQVEHTLHNNIGQFHFGTLTFDTLARAVDWVRANIIGDLVDWYSEQASKAGWGDPNSNVFQRQVDERSYHAALEWIEEV